VVQVAVDIGVVELQRGEDGGAWTVVQEFWTFVEVSTVVLVAFNHKVRSLPQAKSPVDVAHHGSNKKSWLIASMLQQPGDKGSRRTLAVRAGDDHRVPLLNKEMC